MSVARRIGIGLGVIVGLVVGAFLAFAPAAFEASVNRVSVPYPWPVSPAARALHARLTIVDLHEDTLLWKRDPRAFVSRGHVDLARLEAGNVTLATFSSVTKTPRNQNYERNSDRTDNITLLAIAQLQPLRTWFSLLQRSLWHAEKLHRAEGGASGFRIVRTAADLDAGLAERRSGRNRTLALLSVEGLQNLEGKFDNLDVLYRAGFRMAGLAHFFDNEVAGSVHGERKYGLTPLGRRVVAAMETKGMIVDVAHTSHAAIADVLAIATKPVVFSHGGVKGTCPDNRNLTDAEIRGIARTGGVIGIGLWDAASCSDKPAGAAKAMRYVRDLVGIRAVALGTDFDGAVTEPMDASGLVALTQALLDQGFTPDEVQAAMGGNALRVLHADLPRG